MAAISAKSLLVRCGVAAAIYYVPQDLGVLSLLALNKRSCSAQIAGRVNSGPAESQLDKIIVNYMMDRGFDPSSYSVTKGRRHITVQFS